MKGVSHNPEFCGNAARPFYTSGKRQGQWKKRQGADEAAYDAWYAEQLAAIEGNDEEEDDLPPISTAGAFGAKPAPAAEPCPDNTGAYMGWVSEKMAAGLLTQADTDEAHRRFGITLGHLFPPTPPAEVQQHIENLHRALSAVATSRTAGA